MTTIYQTRDGDTVDFVAWKFYGATDNRVVEQVLEANPGLADRGAILPGGVEIVLPEISKPATHKGIRLWD